LSGFLQTRSALDGQLDKLFVSTFQGLDAFDDDARVARLVAVLGLFLEEPGGVLDNLKVFVKYDIRISLLSLISNYAL
jgi:hypothetical protein